MKRKLAVGVGVAVVLFMVILLAPHLLSLPLPGFMVRQLKQDITSSHEKNSSLSVANGRLVFARDGNIYSVALDGGDLKQLTTDLAGEWDPSYSSDGREICFRRQWQRPQSETDIPYDYNAIVVMRSEGGDERVVVEGRDYILNEDPSFSPNGQKIVFLQLDVRPPNERPPDARRNVCEVNLDGSGLRDLGAELSIPVYSVDGKEILAFDHESDAGSSGAVVWEINPETLERHVVGRMPIESYELRYSPDRTQVVFVGLDANDRNGAVYQYQVYRAAINGANIRKLTHDPGPKHQPTFTPDGLEIIFLHEQREKKVIKRMNSDGTNVRTVTEW